MEQVPAVACAQWPRRRLHKEQAGGEARQGQSHAARTRWSKNSVRDNFKKAKDFVVLVSVYFKVNEPVTVTTGPLLFKSISKGV